MPNDSTNFVLVGIGTLAPASIAAAAWFAVPRFIFMFEAFEASLPTLSQLVFASYRWWGLVPLAVLAFGMLSPRTRGNSITTCSVGVTFAIVMALVGVWGCYAPIFHLANEV